MSASAPSRVARDPGPALDAGHPLTSRTAEPAPDPVFDRAAATRAPSSRRKARPKPRWDAAAVLSVYAFLIMLMPATETVANLGALGSPATM